MASRVHEHGTLTPPLSVFDLSTYGTAYRCRISSTKRTQSSTGFVTESCENVSRMMIRRHASMHSALSLPRQKARDEQLDHTLVSLDVCTYTYRKTGT
jgi:hypothetical protein